MQEWTFIKSRTAAQGAVWRSGDGQYFKRTGDHSVCHEAAVQHKLAQLGYPVPTPKFCRCESDNHFFIEDSLGNNSLHDKALTDSNSGGDITQETLEEIIDISSQLLRAQLRTAKPAAVDVLHQWFTTASFSVNVYAENPAFNTQRTHDVVHTMLERIAHLPLCHSHLDYGLPNMFPIGIIDWQHHTYAPIGYDTYPALAIVAFKGGSKGYAFHAHQQHTYLAALDAVCIEQDIEPLSTYLSDFLLVKCFFFLALMKPQQHSSHDKYGKWRYRQHLFQLGLSQYETDTLINTSQFPTLTQFHHNLDA